MYQQIVDDWYCNRETADVELVVCMDNIIVDKDISDKQRGAFAQSVYNYLLDKNKTTEFDQYAHSAVNTVALSGFNECELDAFRWISFTPAYVEVKKKWIGVVFLSPTGDETFITEIVSTNNIQPTDLLRIFWSKMGPTVIGFTVYDNTNKIRGCRVLTSPQTPELMVINIDHNTKNSPPINTQNSSRYGSKKKKNKKKNKKKKEIEEIEEEEKITECNCCLEEDEEIAWHCKTCKRGMICIKCVKPWMRKNPDHKCPCCRT